MTRRPCDDDRRPDDRPLDDRPPDHDALDQREPTRGPIGPRHGPADALGAVPTDSDDDAWPDPPWPPASFEALDDDEDDWYDLAGPDDDLPPAPLAPLTTPDATLDCLLALVGPERAGPPAIWLLPVDAERYALPFVLPVADVLESADVQIAARLVAAVAPLLEAAAPCGGSIVVGLVRAAGGDRGPFETSWARVLREAADELDVDVHAVVAIGRDRARVLEW